MGWTVVRPLKVKRGDGYVILNGGESLPEFDSWLPAHQAVHLRMGQVKWVGEARTMDASAPAPKRRGRPPKVQPQAEAG